MSLYEDERFTRAYLTLPVTVMLCSDSSGEIQVYMCQCLEARAVKTGLVS